MSRAERMTHFSAGFLTERRAIFREARNLGFVDAWRMREGKGSDYELRCLRFNRVLIMRINQNGEHSVSHGTVNVPGGCHETTLATPFRDLAGMYRAIAFEWQRPSTPIKMRNQ